MGEFRFSQPGDDEGGVALHDVGGVLDHVFDDVQSGFHRMDRATGLAHEEGEHLCKRHRLAVIHTLFRVVGGRDHPLGTQVTDLVLVSDE